MGKTPNRGAPGCVADVGPFSLEIIAPGVSPAIGTAGGLFLFRLCWQPLAGPSAIYHRLLPTHDRHRQIGPGDSVVA